MAAMTVNPRRNQATRAKRVARMLTEGGNCDATLGGNTCAGAINQPNKQCNDVLSECLLVTSVLPSGVPSTCSALSIVQAACLLSFVPFVLLCFPLLSAQMAAAAVPWAPTPSPTAKKFTPYHGPPPTPTRTPATTSAARVPMEMLLAACVSFCKVCDQAVRTAHQAHQHTRRPLLTLVWPNLMVAVLSTSLLAFSQQHGRLLRFWQHHVQLPPVTCFGAQSARLAQPTTLLRRWLT